jgi:D-amino-acid dehydrogenase
MSAGAAAMAPLAELSDKLWDDWLVALGQPCERLGLLDVYARPGPFAAARRRAEELSRRGIAVSIVDSAAARHLEPALRGEVAGAVHLTGDRSIDPTAAMDALVARVREAGIELLPNTDVREVVRRADRATAVRLRDAELEAAAVVVAGGAETARMGRGLGERIPVLPARGMSITAERPAVGPSRALLLGEDHVAVTPIAEVLRLSAFFQLGHRETTPDHRCLAQLEALTRRRLELDPVLTVRRRWAGLRPVTPDGLPIIGRASRCSNVVIATGHAMTGLSLAPATGRLVAQLVTGEPTGVPLEPFSPGRFR